MTTPAFSGNNQRAPLPDTRPPLRISPVLVHSAVSGERKFSGSHHYSLEKEQTSVRKGESQVELPVSEQYHVLSLAPNSIAAEQAHVALTVLGTVLRSKGDPYIDALAFQDPELPRYARGGICELFPERMHRLLRESEVEGLTDIVTWLPHGRAFLIKDRDRFISEVAPRYFNDKMKWSSFSRQLYLYGYLRLTSGPDRGAFYHELFLKCRPSLCRYMRRVGTPMGRDRRVFKLREGKDPDLYALTVAATIPT